MASTPWFKILPGSVSRFMTVLLPSVSVGPTAHLSANGLFEPSSRSKEHDGDSAARGADQFRDLTIVVTFNVLQHKHLGQLRRELCQRGKNELPNFGCFTGTIIHQNRLVGRH